MEPFNPDPEHLDPHMEELCRKVQSMSVASAEGDGGDADAAGGKVEYVLAAGADDAGEQRLQNDWVARSLTSIAPR